MGSVRTLKSLAATFRITPTKEKARKDIPFGIPSFARAFRTYRIERGKKVPVEGLFIQKAKGGLKGGRLASKTEIKDTDV